jgi:hypothetical protein
MFYGEQCGLYVGIHDFVSSWRQSSAPLAVCSQLQLVSSLLRHCAVYFTAPQFLYDTYVKYHLFEAVGKNFA